VEIGKGFELASMMGSEAHDIIKSNSQNQEKKWYRPTNNAGGIEGGMTNGEPVIIRAALKPIATLGKSLESIDMSTGKTTQAHYERSDICVVPAAGVIGEAMAALVLADAMLEKFGGDTLSEISDNYRNYIWNT
jgi:chorismate synthase